MLTISVCLKSKALIDHAHTMNFLSVLPMEGEARANNTDRNLTWIGQITPITSFNVAFRVNLTPDSGRF